MAFELKQCPIDGCDNCRLKQWELMCRLHWFMVPFAIRKRLGEARYDKALQAEAIKAVNELASMKVIYSCVLPPP